MISTIMKNTGGEGRPDGLTGTGGEPVLENGRITDQRSTSVFMGMPGGSGKTSTELPLFMDTLYKGRDFDPL